MRCFVWAVPLALAAAALAQAGHELEGRNVAVGAELYAENCASCHGVNLEGQPNWRVPDDSGVLPAPPHDKSGHTWHHSSQQLFDYTKFGGQEALSRLGVTGFASGMPGFEGALSDQQIWEILAFIASTWPEREAAIQAERSAGH